MRENRKPQDRANDNSCMIDVQVVPRSSRIHIEPVGELQYKIKLTCPPVDGSANKQLIQILADQMSVPQRQVKIVRGETARRKQVLVQGATAAIVKQRLGR